MEGGDKETEPRESRKVQASVRIETRSVARSRGAARGESRLGRDTVRLGRLRRRAPWAPGQPAHGLRRTRVCRPRPMGALRRGEEDGAASGTQAGRRFGGGERGRAPRDLGSAAARRFVTRPAAPRGPNGHTGPSRRVSERNRRITNCPRVPRGLPGPTLQVRNRNKYRKHLPRGRTK